MRDIRAFFVAMFSDWLSGLCGPLSVLPAILSFWASTRTLKVAYAVIAATLWGFSAYRIWAKEHRQKEAIGKRYEGEVPRLGMKVTNLSGVPPRGSMRFAITTEFLIKHLAGRPATSISFAPISSHGGRYSLCLSGLPYLAAGSESRLDFEVWENGRRPFRKIIDALGWDELLAAFLFDNGDTEPRTGYQIIVDFMDHGSYVQQRFWLRFDNTSWRFDLTDDYPGGTLTSSLEQS